MLLLCLALSASDLELQTNGDTPQKSPPSFNGLDTLLVDSAALPEPHTVRVTAAGAVSPSDVADDAKAQSVAGSAMAQVMYVPWKRIAVTGSGNWDYGRFGGTVAMRGQLLSQDTQLVDLVLMARYRSIADEGIGQSIDGKLMLGRTFGAVRTVLNVMLSQSFAGRTDVDVSGGAMVAYQLKDWALLGAEADARGEVVDRLPTIEDQGRKFGLTAGATASFRFSRFFIQALAGVGAPRGPFPIGPAAFLRANYDF